MRLIRQDVRYFSIPILPRYLVVVGRCSAARVNYILSRRPLIFTTERPAVTDTARYGWVTMVFERTFANFLL